jgi:hypothetical protein
MRRRSTDHVLPSYLVIGAQKSGTSFMGSLLTQHPAIAHAPGELHYFDWRFSRGDRWYRAHFPTMDLREEILRRHGEFATGERSPNYLFAPHVPARVRRRLHEVRLVVVLRDPVERALSHYHHNIRIGREHLSFGDAVAYELGHRTTRGRRPGQPRRPGQENSRFYLTRGLYAEQLGRWLSLFERGQIHVTTSTQLFADPAAEVGRVHRFLGLTAVVPGDLTPRNQGTHDAMSEELARTLRGFFAADGARLRAMLPEVPIHW